METWTDLLISTFCGGNRLPYKTHYFPILTVTLMSIHIQHINVIFFIHNLTHNVLPITNPNPSMQNITTDISRILHRYCNFNGPMIFVDVFTLFIQSKLVRRKRLAIGTEKL
jgi:hypothetical protein